MENDVWIAITLLGSLAIWGFHHLTFRIDKMRWKAQDEFRAAISREREYVDSRIKSMEARIGSMEAGRVELRASMDRQGRHLRERIDALARRFDDRLKRHAG